MVGFSSRGHAVAGVHFSNKIFSYVYSNVVIVNYSHSSIWILKIHCTWAGSRYTDNPRKKNNKKIKGRLIDILYLKYRNQKLSV